jgi:hypothetical protein
MLLIYNVLYIYMGDDMNKRYVALGMVIAIVAVVGTAGIPQAIAKGAEFDDGSAHAVDDCKAGFHTRMARSFTLESPWGDTGQHGKNAIQRPSSVLV